MHKLLIVSNTPSPNTRALTEAVVAGARNEAVEKVEVRVREPLDAEPDDVLWADAVILGSTENFGYMSGAMKDFFERIYYACLEKTQGLPYALFIRAGNDGLGAKTSMERIIQGMKWRAVQAPLICTGSFDQAFLPRCEELGLTVAAGLEAGIF